MRSNRTNRTIFTSWNGRLPSVLPGVFLGNRLALVILSCYTEKIYRSYVFRAVAPVVLLWCAGLAVGFPRAAGEALETDLPARRRCSALQRKTGRKDASLFRAQKLSFRNFPGGLFWGNF